MKKTFIILEIDKKSKSNGWGDFIDTYKLKESPKYRTRFDTLEEAEANIPKNYGYPTFTIVTEYVNHELG